MDETIDQKFVDMMVVGALVLAALSAGGLCFIAGFVVGRQTK